MHKLSAKTTFDTVSRVIDSYRNPDPLIVRKKFSVRDTVYKKGFPEHELVRAELSFDTEFCALTVAVLVLTVTAVLCIVGWRRRCRIRHLERQIIKAKRKS